MLKVYVGTFEINGTILEN